MPTFDPTDLPPSLLAVLDELPPAASPDDIGKALDKMSPDEFHELVLQLASARATKIVTDYIDAKKRGEPIPFYRPIDHTEAEFFVVALGPLWDRHKEPEDRSLAESIIHVAMGCAWCTLGEARFAELYRSVRAACGKPV